MKRIVALVVGMTVLLSTVAYAVGIDLDSMTLGELQELQKEIRERITAMLVDNSSDLIYLGEYIGGEDIKSGIYLAYSPDKHGGLILYSSRERNDKNIVFNAYLDNEDPHYIELKDGMLMRVLYAPIQLVPWTKPALAP